MKNAESPPPAETGKRPAGGEDPASAFQVNGEAFFHSGDPAMPLLWYLRDVLRLTGTKYGCDTGNCGTCTVLIDGKARRACQVPMADLSGHAITTIEGLESNRLHPVQQAWIEQDVAQCGYCQSGQIMSAVALLTQNRKPTDTDIDNAMSGNLCRCATYVRIRAAIHEAAKALA